MPDELRGREIVVVGGSGGLGCETSRLLAEEGARLVVSYRSNAERARSMEPVAKVVQADIASSTDRRCLLDAAREIYGLVVFSGDPARASAQSQVEEVMRRSHEINYLGPALLAREAAERMKAAGTPGAIVLISTM